MNSNVLKIIACITMLIDHIGAVLFPEIYVLRMIGRLSFPIFAFLIAEGYSKTSNIDKYIKRMAIFALISQIPFCMAFNGDKSGFSMLYFGTNVMFTFTGALIGIKLSEKHNNNRYIFLAAFICEFLLTDYGFFGVIFVYIMYKYKNNFSKMAKYVSAITIALCSCSCIFYLIINPSLGLIDIIQSNKWIQVLSLFSLFFIKAYNGKRGELNLKYFFYCFYPTHLVILFLIKKFLF